MERLGRDFHGVPTDSGRTRLQPECGSEGTSFVGDRGVHTGEKDPSTVGGVKGEDREEIREKKTLKQRLCDVGR